MTTPRNAAPARWSRVRRDVVSSPAFRSTRSMMNRMNSGSIICSPATTRAMRKRAPAAYRCGHSRVARWERDAARRCARVEQCLDRLARAPLGPIRVGLRRGVRLIAFEEPAHGGIVAEDGGGMDVAARELRVRGQDRLGALQ